jgi:hypothetical protein
MQYLNYRMMKKQLKLLGAFVKSQSSPDEDDSLTWLKLLFQRTLDSEIMKMLEFYQLQARLLDETVDNLRHREKEIVLSILNVRTASYACPTQYLESSSSVCSQYVL